MSAVAGVKKVKKVTKTTKKMGGDGETMVETVTRVTSETNGTNGLENDEMVRNINGSQEIHETFAKEKDYEYEILFCHHCDDSLAGHRYVLRDDRPYCIKCYENQFANNCDECRGVIGIDSKDLSYKEKHWHESCFLCSKCRNSLVDKQFGSKADRIYCGQCYDAQFAARCDGCRDVFKAGMKKMEYKTRQWHEKCFTCVVCANPIGKEMIEKSIGLFPC